MHKRIITSFISLLLAFITVLLTVAGCGKTEQPGANTDNGNTSNNGESVPGVTAQTGASETETALSNTVKLLQTEKKLTIGYIGGSITLGSSAATYMFNSELNKQADLKNSWVNRMSNYFAEKYPDAVIETVNAGISNTQTNFGIYRLTEQLMNTDGHDMPDLVFIEFTTNDWIGGDDLKIEIESLIRNIYAANPYAEIVIISTNVSTCDSKKLYRELAGEYGIPFVDVGSRLRNCIREKFGTPSENGPYFYTVDNLHPSAEGYKIYSDLIIENIQPLLDTELKTDKIYNYYENLREPICSNLITNPKKTTVETLKFSGNAVLVNSPLTVNYYGTDLQLDTVDFVPSYTQMNTGSTVSADFSGTAFGVIIGHTKNSFKFSYRIDGGEWKVKEQTSHLYEHTQVYILEHTLSEGNHTVEIKAETDGLRFGGILTNGN